MTEVRKPCISSVFLAFMIDIFFGLCFLNRWNAACPQVLKEFPRFGLSFPRQRLETRDDIEQFFINAVLALLLVTHLNLLKHLLDVLLRPLHRSEPAGVFAREGFRAGLK